MALARSTRSRGAVAERVGAASTRAPMAVLLPLLCMAIGASALWAASADTARAQGSPSPFAGTWHGNLRASSVTVCNGSTQTCTYTQPYSGTVDSLGNFDGVWNPATETCIGLGGGTYPRASVRRTFQVPSNGTALVYTHTYSLNGVQGSCPLNAQFRRPRDCR